MITMCGIELPNTFKPIGYKWVFKTKRGSRANIERHKAGSLPKVLLNEKELILMIVSPISSKDSFRIIMALVAHF